MKKLLSILLALCLLTACGHRYTPKIRTVGISMPTQFVQRWLNDGANMKEQLEAKGYEVQLEYAEDDIALQVKQIQSMLDAGVDCLVISSIDSTALLDVQEQARALDVPVIAYDRLLMQSDAVSYYATFDNEGVGRILGQYIVEAGQLDTATEPCTIEFFMGSPDDNNALMTYRGLMEVLQPYLDSGVLVCRSGKTSFEDTCILRWSRQAAKERCAELLSGVYAGGRPDILCSAFDGLSYGCGTALLEAGFQPGLDWPLLTGQDADIAAIRDIRAGYQTMTIFKDTRVLAAKCVTMVDAVLTGSNPQVNDRLTYNNGVKVVPAYLCTPVAVDAGNYREILIDSGYYTEKQLDE